MIISDDSSVRRLLLEARRIAVLGIKPESRAEKAAHYVPLYLAHAGYEIVPVPVYYPDVREILGQPVYRRLADVPGQIDVVQVFRKPEDVPPHVPDIVAARPRAVWMQSGIRNDEAAEELSRSGIIVVQDRCMMVEHERLITQAGA